MGRINNICSDTLSTNLKSHLSRTCAAGAIIAASMMVGTTAQAQMECGSPSGNTVTCSPDDNPYPNGITYFPTDDLTIVLQDGVVVDTSDSFFASGLLLFGSDGDLLVDGDTNTSITANDFSFNILAAANDGDITLNLDQVIGGSLGIDASSATGDVTVTANSVTTSVAGADAVSATSNSGDAVINIGAVTTTGAGAAGINALTDGDIDIDFGTVDTAGTGVTATAGSDSIVTIDGTSVTTSGPNAIGINATGGAANDSTTTLTANVDSVTTTGAGSDGISVQNRFGMTTVNVGTVSTMGADAEGIVASGRGAGVTFDSVTTAGDGAEGILVPAGSLFQPNRTTTAVINGGTVSTTGANAAGISASANDTVTVDFDSITTTGDGSAGVLVPVGTGGFLGTDPTPNAVITGGDISTTGIGSNAVNVTSALDSTINLNGTISTTGAASDAVVINAGDNAALNVGTGGSISAANGNGATITSVNGTTIANAGTIGAAANGLALQVIGGSATITNSGTLSSDIQLTAADDSLTNSALFNVTDNPDFGLGNDSFTNGNGGTVLLAAPNAIFTGLETFNNGGLVELRNGTVGNMLTLSGDYVGNGGTLGIDADLAAGTADQLLIGGSATGNTNVAVDASGATLNNPTIFAQTGAASSANAFTTNSSSGFVQLNVVYDPAAMTYSLLGTPGNSAARTVGLVEAGRSIWYKSADAWSSHMRARRDGTAAYGAGQPGSRLWGQIFGSYEERDSDQALSNFGISRNIDTSYDQDYYGGQVGMDFGGSDGGDGGFAFGVTGGYINSTMSFSGSADRVDFDALNAGIYASYNAGILFVNGLAKYDHYFIDPKLGGLSGKDLDADVYGALLEAGARFGSDKFFIEPVASISYVKSDLDDLDIAGSSFHFKDDDGVRGKLGARVGTTFNLFDTLASAYVGGNYVHEFKGDDVVLFTNGGTTTRFRNNSIGDYGEGVIGLNIGSADGVSGFFEAYGATGKDIDAGGGRAGLRMRF